MRDEFTTAERILVALRDNNGQLPLKVIFAGIDHRNNSSLEILKGLGLIELRRRADKPGKLIALLQLENEGGEIDLLDYFKILREFGLTNEDIKILKAKGNDPEAIAQEKELPVNIVRQRIVNIFARLEVDNLRKARSKVSKRTKVPA